MATTNSTANLITMTAQNDVARTGAKVRVAGVVAVTSSLTAAGTVKLTDGAGTLDIVPTARAKSGAGTIIAVEFVPFIEVVGLKAVNCTNANIRIQLA
jgi:hypothetical protein